MKKADREKVFNKYDGKCAYCGEDLKKGWHVDEVEPVVRNMKFLREGYYHKLTKKLKMTHEVAVGNPNYEYKKSRWVADGCKHPERFTLSNQNPACASCNINKHSLSLEEFRRLVGGFMKHLNERSTQYKIAKRYGLVEETREEVKFYFEKVQEHLVLKPNLNNPIKDRHWCKKCNSEELSYGGKSERGHEWICKKCLFTFITETK